MNRIVISSEILRNWLASGLEGQVNLHAFLTPAWDGRVDCAGLQFEKNDFLCSVSVWGAGTVEWIVMDGRTGENYEVEDSEFASEAELLNKLEEIRSKIDRLVRG